MRSRVDAGVIAVLLGVLLAGGRSGEGAARALSFVLDTTANRATEAQAVAAQLGRVGINAQVRVWQLSVLIAQVQAGQRAVYTTDWGSAYFDPYDLAVPKFVTKARGNFSFYSNADVDRRAKGTT